MTKEELYYLPASELLKHIQSEKERLIKEKVIKKPKPLLPITKEEKPYNLPVGWEWVRLGDVVEFYSGSTFPTKYQGRNNEAINFFKVGSLKDVDKNNLLHQSENTINETDLKELNIKLTPPNTIVFAKIGEAIRLNRRAILANYSCIDNNLMGIRTINEELLRNKFLFQWLKQLDLYELSNATAVPSVKKSIIELLLFPIPPLYIQDQIVQKLEQLSEIKDALLYHADQQFNYIKKMREALLQEAIRGDLVPQHDNDKPASVLLEKIKVEKERLIKEKVIKKSKPLPLITEEEKPYDLPVGWEWVRLGDVVEFYSGSAFPTKYQGRSNEKYNFYKVGSLKDADPVTHLLHYSSNTISEQDLKDLKITLTPPNTILFAKIGEAIRLNRRAILSDYSCIDNNLMGIKSLNPHLIRNSYLFQWLKQLDLYALSNATAVPSVKKSVIECLLFPLPPLAEQDRIIAKLDELMANCDQLEVRAEEMKNYTTKLFEASLKAAFMPE